MRKLSIDILRSVKLNIFIIIIFLSVNVFSYKENIEKFRAKMTSISIVTADEAELHGAKRVHKKNSKGTVLLVHGFSEKEKLMVEMAQQYFKNGYNVVTYNMRGHGSLNGKIKRSIAKEGHYSFDHIVAFDIPAMVESAIKETNKIPKGTSVRDFIPSKPVTLIGHSMGGQAAKASLVGARMMDDGKMYISFYDQKWMAKRVRLVAIASPSSFKGGSKLYDFGSKIVTTFPRVFERFGKKMFFKVTNGIVSVVNNEKSIVSSIKIDSLVKNIKGSSLSFLARSSLVEGFLKGIIKASELTHGELRFVQECIGRVEEELSIQAFGWRKNGYKSLCGTINYELLKLFEGESMMVAVDEDKLAHPKAIRAFVGRETSNNSVRYVKVINGGSHIDSIIGKGLKKLMPALLSFSDIGWLGGEYEGTNKIILDSKDLVSETPYQIIKNPGKGACSSWISRVLLGN